MQLILYLNAGNFCVRIYDVIYTAASKNLVDLRTHALRTHAETSTSLPLCDYQDIDG